MKSFPVPGTDSRLRYHDLPGSGTPLVLLHGLGCASSCDYPTVAADAALRGRRMLLIDLLGSGFSDRPEAFGYTIDDHARSIVALVEALGLPQVDLFGHSMGGTVAIVAATMLGACLGRLVVGEPNLDPGGGVFSRRIAVMAETDYRAAVLPVRISSRRCAGSIKMTTARSASAPSAPISRRPWSRRSPFGSPTNTEYLRPLSACA